MSLLVSRSVSPDPYSDFGVRDRETKVGVFTYHIAGALQIKDVFNLSDIFGVQRVSFFIPNFLFSKSHRTLCL